MLRVIAFIVILAIYIYTIVDVLRTPNDKFKVLSKPWWIFISLIPGIGAVLWLLFGMPKAPFARSESYKSAQKSTNQPSKAPDDDIDFLRQLNVKNQRKNRSESNSSSHGPTQNKKKSHNPPKDSPHSENDDLTDPDPKN